MRFAIYIPGNTLPDETKLADVGLSHLTANVAGIGTPRGPDGGPGIVFSWPQGARGPIAYLPDQQEWTPADAEDEKPAGRYWVGFFRGQPPTPNDLAWPTQFDGAMTKLGDGNQWNIPVAGKLPMKCERGPDGKWGFIVRQQFEWFWEESRRWRVQLGVMGLVGANNGMYSIDASCCEYLTRALGMNYMLTPEVVSRLGLFGSDTILDAMAAIQDVQSLVDEQSAQKKNRQHTDRYLIFLAWSKGLFPDHIVTWADLHWLGQ